MNSFGSFGDWLERVGRHLEGMYFTLLAAWAYATPGLLPARMRKHTARHSYESSIRYSPAVGVFIGAIAGAVFIGTEALLESKSLAILFALGSASLLTGMQSENGLAHWVQALPGDRISPKDALAQLQTPALYTSGCIALILSVLLRHQLLLHIETTLVPLVLIAAHAFSRFLAASFIFTHRRVGDSRPKKYAPRPYHFMLLALVGTLPLVLIGDLLFLALTPLTWGISFAMGWWLTTRLGGYTVGVLGAVQQLIEISVYILVVVTARFTINI